MVPHGDGCVWWGFVIRYWELAAEQGDLDSAVNLYKLFEFGYPYIQPDQVTENITLITIELPCNNPVITLVTFKL